VIPACSASSRGSITRPSASKLSRTMSGTEISACDSGVGVKTEVGSLWVVIWSSAELAQARMALSVSDGKARKPSEFSSAKVTR
jgi:hypothetical protein